MTAQTILPANSVTDTGYNVDNSVRFNSGDNCKISRTSPNSSPTNAKRFTISFWVKRSNIDAGSGHEHQQIFDSNDGSEGPNIQFQMYFTQNTLRLQTYNGSNKMELVTNRLFRDISAWYSIIFSYDSTPSTPSASSVRLWINGVLETSFSTAVYPSQNTDGEFAIQNDIQMIGNNTANTRDLGGYLAEVIGVDGQALVNTDFGEFDEDSGIFKPIDVSGIDVGTLGFYLDFEDSSALGNDVSGVGDFTLVNLAAVDQSTDTCTNNFATLNPLSAGVGDVARIPTFSEGNTKFTAAGSNTFYQAISTFGAAVGKWYFEVKVASDQDLDKLRVGYWNIDKNVASGEIQDVSAANSGVFYMNKDGGEMRLNATSTTADYGTFGDNELMGVAIDMDAQTITILKANSVIVNAYDYSGGIAAGTVLTPAFMGYDDTAFQVNYGNPHEANSSDAADGNSYGAFEFAPPSGYFSWCTKNLAEYG